MKISFDFDNTLTEPHIQAIASGCLLAGHEVWVTTSRREIDSGEVYEVCRNIGIPTANCNFTHFEDKVEHLDGFDIHFDDDDYEIDLINRQRFDTGKGCRGILLGFINWRADLVKTLPNDDI